MLHGLYLKSLILFASLFFLSCAEKIDSLKSSQEELAYSKTKLIGRAPKNTEYKLQATDVLKITVHEHPDLDTSTRITTNGYITFPLVGEVKAEGITVRELQARIKYLLEKDYLTTAQVHVFIEQYRIKQVSVIGEVNTPGKYDMTAERDTTLLEAIALAGGFTKDANENGTKIIRVRDGKTKTIEVRVSDIKKGRMQDIVIEPEDIISVPESFF